MDGWIYIFSNPSYRENIIKIGKTARSPDKRIREVDSTGVPQPFVLEYKAYVKNHNKVEKIIHRKLSAYRIRRSREFFKCETSIAVRAIRDCSVIIHDAFPSKELAARMRENELSESQKKLDQKRAYKAELERKDNQRKEVDRQLKKLLQPKDFNELSKLGKLWRLFWSFGKPWIRSLSYFERRVICFFCMILHAINGIFLIFTSGFLFENGDLTFLPIWMLGLTICIKTNQLMFVSSDLI